MDDRNNVDKTTVAPYRSGLGITSCFDTDSGASEIKCDYPHEILGLQDNIKEKNILFGCVNYVTGTRPVAGSYSHFALQHPHGGFLCALGQAVHSFS